MTTVKPWCPRKLRC